jgi:hypothetical protein
MTRPESFVGEVDPGADPARPSPSGAAPVDTLGHRSTLRGDGTGVG